MLAVVILTPATSFAASTGSKSQTPAASTTWQTWNAPNHTASLKAALNSANSGNCAESIFDWSISGHYDVRLFRTCVVTSSPTPPGYSSWTRRPATPIGENKYGGCMVNTPGSNGTGARTASTCEGVNLISVAGCGAYSAMCVVVKNGVYATYPGGASDPGQSNS